MKNVLKFLAIAVVILGFSANSFGQLSASADASASIVTPLKIVKATDLVFGKLAPSGTIGSVAVTTAGIRSTPTGSIQLIGTVTPQAASFTVTGETGLVYAITLPDDGTVSLTSGLNSMAVTGFTSDPDGSATLVAGNNTISVGATIAVSATQESGDYTGSFDVSVVYE